MWGTIGSNQPQRSNTLQQAQQPNNSSNGLNSQAGAAWLNRSAWVPAACYPDTDLLGVSPGWMPF